MSSPPSALKAVACIHYYTGDGDRRKDDFDGNFMVRAIKGIPVNGYFDCPLLSGGTKRFTQDNVAEFTAMIPARMFRAIASRIEGPATLIPIPNSQVTSPISTAFKTLALAQAIAQHSEGRFAVHAGLVFATPQQPSKEGGTRDAAHLEAAYTTLESVGGKLVLVDDVVTTGGHFIGAYRRLNRDNSPVVLAAAFAHSTKEQLQNPNNDHDFEIGLKTPGEQMAEMFGEFWKPRDPVDP